MRLIRDDIKNVIRHTWFCSDRLSRSSWYNESKTSFRELLFAFFSTILPFAHRNLAGHCSADVKSISKWMPSFLTVSLALLDERVSRCGNFCWAPTLLFGNISCAYSINVLLKLLRIEILDFGKKHISPSWIANRWPMQNIKNRQFVSEVLRRVAWIQYKGAVFHRLLPSWPATRKNYECNSSFSLFIGKYILCLIFEFPIGSDIFQGFVK